MIKRAKPETREEYMARYPRITAHIICHSLGYATPTTAAAILKDAREGKPNWCEWIYSCYGGEPKNAVRQAIQNRHCHRGFMAEFKRAYALVQRAVKDGAEPVFMSW